MFFNGRDPIRTLASLMLNQVMMQKNALTMPKPWSHSVSFAAHLHEILGQWRNALAIPNGYEDENGFHRGAEPAAKETKQALIA